MKWEIFLGVVILFIITIIIFNYVKTKKAYNNILNCLIQIKEKYGFNLKENSKLKNTEKKKNNIDWEFELENDNLIIYITYVLIPSNSSVTINSKNTWCLRWGGKRVGRSYPNKRYMTELVNFLGNNKKSQKRTIRLVVIYPNCEVILKYLNESELATVYPKDSNHGIKVVKYPEILASFEEIVK